MEPSPARAPHDHVPVRTILATVGIVLGTVVGLWLLWSVKRILGWMVIAAFFAIVLGPAVDFLEQRAKLRRSLATLLVFLTGLALLAAMLYAFIRPIVDQATTFSDHLPKYVADAKAGRGWVGHLVKKYKIDDYVEKNQKKLKSTLSDVGKRGLKTAGTVARGLIALVTILVLTILMLMQGPSMLQSGLGALSPPTRERVRRVGGDCARALTGYMFGNLLISVIAGVATFIFLWIIGVPFMGVLGLWVGFADLIPMVGATLGAIPAVLVAFLHSPAAGIGTIIFFIAYQQFENHVLQVTVMARTVDINPLMVLVSVLIGVEAFGVLGALLAIPAAGVIQVIGRDIYDERRGRLKPEPTVGTDEHVPTPDEESGPSIDDRDPPMAAGGGIIGV
ncbi:MAG: AI-2E family transporter [Actinobacteria bacterium]|nr:AI-2E family transporter [Actinomycetota bacterium]MBV8959588.1 AI-2E family transporter [Actinomycetota bacterium]MBV9252779.1 AI-2E family transporter [Actinomycetota bacterium]MBV9665546.1 AI-2E family transporter [Actinomycetota bacterium]MBV9933080.1 AI-2E family transporter [Actinomycetota bacterium]